MIRESIDDIQHIRTWEDLKKWIKDSGTRLEILTGTDGFDNIGGRLFRSGESGRVWKLKGVNATLKLTTDPEEISLAKKIEGQNLPTFIDIYKSLDLKGIGKDGEKVPAQIRVQELCYPVKWSELSNIGKDDLFEFVQKFIDQALQNSTVTINTEFAKEFIRAAGDATGYGKYQLSETELQTVVKLLNFSIQLLSDMKKLTGETDLTEVDFHDGNLMQNAAGEWKMVDF